MAYHSVRKLSHALLGEICDFKSGNSLPDGQDFAHQKDGYLLLKVSDLNRPENIPIIQESGLWTNVMIRKSILCDSGSVILPKRGGAIATNKKRLLSRPAFLDPNLMGVEPHKGKIDSLYLYYWFQQFDLTEISSGTAVPQLNKQDLYPLKIPLPPLEEQRRIAAILDKADEVRRKRQEAIRLTEELLRSLFLDMFGDPVTNPKGWKITSVSKVTSRITKGESPKWQGYSYQENGVLFITSENVLWGKIDYSEPKFIPDAFHKKLSRSQLSPNDVLINLVGASVGRTCIVPDEAIPANINQAVAVLSLDEEVCEPTFLLHQLLNDSVQRSLLGQAVESARANISLTNIRELEVILPPSEEQKRWKNICYQQEMLMKRELDLLKEADNFFNSLLQRAFRGEL